MRRSRAASGALLAVLAVVSPSVLGGPAAAAGEKTTLTVPYSCVATVGDTVYEPVETELDVALEAPDAVNPGTVVVRWELEGQLPAPPVGLEGVVTTTTAEVAVVVDGGEPSVITTTSEPSESEDAVAGGALPVARSLAVVIPVGEEIGSVVTVTPGDIKLDLVAEAMTEPAPGAGGVEIPTTDPTGTTETTDPEVGDGETATGDAIVGSVTCEAGEVPGALNLAVTSSAVARAGCALNDDCDVRSFSSNPTEGGELRQDVEKYAGNADAFTINFGTVSSSSSTQVIVRSMNAVRITDLREGTWGFTLTASLSEPITSASGGTIPASALRVKGVWCDESPELPVPAPWRAGTPGTFASPRMMCAKDQGSVSEWYGNGMGIYVMTADLELTVPRFSQAGEYAGVINLQLT